MLQQLRTVLLASRRVPGGASTWPGLVTTLQQTGYSSTQVAAVLAIRPHVPGVATTWPDLHRQWSSQPSGDDEGGPHPYFPRMSSENSLQPRFEAAEVAKAYDGLFAAPWFSLYTPPADALLQAATRPLRALRSLLMGGVLNRVSDIATDMVQNEVEGSFDRDEFLEGATMAIEATLEQVPAKDQSSLRESCSQRLLDRFNIAKAELVEEHELELVSLHVKELSAVRLASINLWKKENIARFDDQWPTEVTPATSSSWLVATVAVQASLEAEYKSVNPDAQGSQVVKQQLEKEGSWLFTRGPLPRGFTSQLQLPWKVLAVW